MKKRSPGSTGKDIKGFMSSRCQTAVWESLGGRKGEKDTVMTGNQSIQGKIHLPASVG